MKMFNSNTKDTTDDFELLNFVGTIVSGTQFWNDVKKKQYPFMAFIYYQDGSIIDANSDRFVRGAVLIRADWLISGIIEQDGVDSFPNKTLLAQTGSISINEDFIVLEDNDEQEREIIKIISPSNGSETQEISLLKTLMPFEITKYVIPVEVHVHQDLDNEPCSILAYVKKDTTTKIKVLMVFPVEIIDSSKCSEDFNNETMLCGTQVEGQEILYPKFCEGNTGAPLICGNKLIGTQIYTENKCEPPYMFNLLAKCKKFINCGLDGNCASGKCQGVCNISDKDTNEKTIIDQNVSAEEETKPNATETFRAEKIKDNSNKTSAEITDEADTSVEETTLGKNDSSDDTTTIPDTTLIITEENSKALPVEPNKDLGTSLKTTITSSSITTPVITSNTDKNEDPEESLRRYESEPTISPFGSRMIKTLSPPSHHTSTRGLNKPTGIFELPFMTTTTKEEQNERIFPDPRKLTRSLARNNRLATMSLCFVILFKAL